MWTFIQYQIFGMKWLNVLISNILESSGIDTSTRIGASVLFFFSMIQSRLRCCCVF